jgi:hypothetical protein
MGRLVQLWKCRESTTVVAYLYGDRRETAGELEIDKESGRVSLICAVPGYGAQRSWFLFGQLAEAKARHMFQRNAYPEEDCAAT